MPLPAVILRAVAAVKAYFRRCFNFENLTDLDAFSQDTFNILAELYSTLFLVSTSMTAGLWLQSEGDVGVPLTVVGISGSMFCLFATPRDYEVFRSFSLYAAAFFMGASWLPCTQPYLNFFDPNYIIAVLLGNTLCVVVFRTITRWVRGRERFAIYSYAAFYSTILSMVWTGYAFYYFNVYLVLATFLYLVLILVYVMLYSQEMAARAAAGQEIDSVNFSMRFFTDAPGIWIYSLVLLFRFADEEGLKGWELLAMLNQAIAERRQAMKQGPKTGKKGKRKGRKN
ncbi:PREDICTED: uncharacterized protein LOC109186547 [Ipomoea nil]|uniref:uncharacterized protein LOC109186547 n=1 Tax=Ipomoea nil TaxID=35883 RepID=UPI000901F410|nr:PREDICTED: uncharacterized protein LOC109186547 [Ipomoea nil]